MRIGYQVVAGLSLLLLAGCGDDDACERAHEVEAGITRNAVEVDQIPAAGICALGEADIARRLMDHGRPVFDDMVAARERAREYVANCDELRDLREECGG